jgi:uncharacterized membrane protein
MEDRRKARIDRRKEDNKKGDAGIKQLKFVVGCMLIGSVVAGALFGWLGAPFDIRIIGASVGATAGMVANHLAAA